MDTMPLQFLEALSNAFGPPGFEREPLRLVRDYVEPFAESIRQDKMGSLLYDAPGSAEAPVVLISMVTSGAEYVPRNIEFLYSPNRLNVALSRAQCLAVVVFNPKLLEISCKTIEQMKLANTFCRLREYADMLT